MQADCEAVSAGKGLALSRPRQGELTQLSPRALVLAIIASLHAAMIYLLVMAPPDRGGPVDTSVIDAEVIAAERRTPSPPPLPPVMLDDSVRIDPLPLQLSIDLPAEEPPPAQTADPQNSSGLLASSIATAPTAPQTESIPVTRPRPIAGPSGVSRYPNASIRAKESGTVDMNICVSPTGRVDSVEVAHSSGFPRLDATALGMAAEYRFQPATRAGHPIAACAHYRIVFKVKA
jgi:protein TonB